MKRSFSHCGLVAALALCSLCCATGCRSGAWGWPAASNNWLSWKNWGWNKSEETALASKPTTSAPKPSSTATPQPTTSIAAGTGVSGASVAANTSYPLTSQGQSSPYATQPASAYQQAGATSQVQPSVGYQTGPYNVNTTAGAGAGSAYNQPAANSGNSWNPDASGGYNTANSAPQNYGGQGYTGQGYGTANQPTGSYNTTAPSGDYRTADGRSMYGTQETSPYSADPSQQGSYSTGGYSQPSTGGATGGYNTSGGANDSYSAPATGTPGSGAVPAPSTNPWNRYQPPAPATFSSSAPSAAGYSAATAAAQPAANPAASNYPAVPAALATSGDSYRPGSTATQGAVQNAAYNQPSASGAINYGNSYLR